MPYHTVIDEEAAGMNKDRDKQGKREEQPKPYEPYDDTLYNEEFASEAGAYTPMVTRPLVNPEEERPWEHRETRSADEGQAEARNSSALGWTAIIAAFVSLFVWPYVLGPAAAVLGFVAYFQGSRTLGVWSIVLGVLSMLSYWVLVPLYT
jgi:hypothetical protein